MNSPDIQYIARLILDTKPGPGVRVRLLRDVLDVPPENPELTRAKNDLDKSRWVAMLRDDQRPDGSWGRFHSADTKRKQTKVVTTWRPHVVTILIVPRRQPTMKYRDLPIQTQREFPNNMRTEGFGWLVRAGYLTRENGLTPLGQRSINHLRDLARDSSFIPSTPLRAGFHLSAFLPTLSASDETLFPISTGDTELIHCPACGYTARKELALFQKTPFSTEEPQPAEKVSTPDCHTIESLAAFLNIPKEKTAKAMMFTRVPSGKFVFVVIRGDMNLSETKLKNAVGDVRLATAEEIEKSGAAAGYASPVGLTDALIVVDDLIPHSPNLVAGANEAGYHLLHTNCGHDYQPEIVTDLALADAGHACAMCGSPLSVLVCVTLATRSEFFFENILLALAESHHDDKGLAFPKSAAPFDVYLMHVPGKTMDTKAKAEEIYLACQSAGLSVLFDDRDERAGVKFNDADLIGCPVRVTVGERGLQGGMVEVKARKAGENLSVPISDLVSSINQNL